MITRFLQYLFLAFTLLFITNQTKAQLSPADSNFMNGLYDYPLYIDTSVYQGNWYINDTVASVYNHYLRLDTGFKFKTAHLDSISYLTIGDSLIKDTARNAAFNAYPALLTQHDPMVFLPFSFLNKQANTYAIMYKDSNQTNCKYAFLLIPGNGHHQGYELAKGIGYHNQLCQIKNLCINYGDVFAFIKPNQESRSVYWNDKRLGDWLIWYLNTASTPYGVNYLIEIIAMVKYLQVHYDKVFVFGLSEGGYATMLTSMYTEPDAVIISGGYSIGLDTNYVENSFLRSRFDYMLDTFNKVKVKTRISNTKTKFLFTWGENDPVPTMDPEHDFHYTETYFSGLTNCSYFYDFYDHTFPPCANIDTFIHRVLALPLAHFVITDSSIVDTLHTKVQFCNSGSYDFDLYKDTTLINHYTSVSDSVSIALSDSGRYYIKNIIDSNNVAGKCGDTVRCNKYPTPLSAFALSADLPFLIHYNNPFREHLNLMISADIPDNFEITIYNNYGMPVHQHQLASGEPFFISSLHWATGLYYLKIHSANSSQNVNLKLLKF